MSTKFFIQLLAGLLLAAALPALADPPARVGRVSHVSGQVSFRADKDDEWTQAALNYPVTSHNQFATSPGARLEIRVGSAAIRLDEDSEISLPRIDDDAIRVNVKRGVANVSVRSRESRNPVEVLTPAGRVTLNGAGTYRFEAGRDVDQTVITAFSGSATLTDEDNQVSIKEGRELIVNGVDPLQYSIRGARRGPFEDWVFARDARGNNSRSARYVSPEIPGQEELDEYGDWQDTPDYGTVWVPRATPVDWAPYRNGRWAWVDPWGWTWVDYAPWGFAPFHYGRWVNYNGYWGWAPGVIASRPVYAPALVGFIGNPGWNVSFSFGSAPAVGWVPLGYYDLYRPGYPCSPTYVRNVNITNINVRNVNVTNVNWSNPPTPDYSLRKFPHAVTVVPQTAFGNGKPVNSQLARLTAPVTEPVIGMAPRIAAPTRRVVVNDGPSQAPQRNFAAPGQGGSQTGRLSATDQQQKPGRVPENRIIGTPAPQPLPQPNRQAQPDVQRKAFRDPDNRTPDNRTPDNRAPDNRTRENRVTGADHPRQPPNVKAQIVPPAQREARQPRVVESDDGSASRRFKHRDVPVAPQRPVQQVPPQPLHQAPPVQRNEPARIVAPAREAAPRESFDGGRKQPHAAPQPAVPRDMGNGIRHEVRPAQETSRAMRAPLAVENGVGGRRVDF